MRILRRKRGTPPPAGPGPGPAPPLDVDVSATAYGALVAIAGELDLATVAKVSEAFASETVQQADAVVVDLTELSFMDSSGLTALLTFQSDLDARRRRLAIACPEGAARLVLDVAGVAERLLEDPAMRRHHRTHAVRAHLLDMAGEREAAEQAYLHAARLTASVPEQRYLNARAARLS